MENFPFSCPLQQLRCIDPHQLLISESGHGVDDPHYNVDTHTSDDPIEFEQPGGLSLEVYQESGGYEPPTFDEHAEHKLIDDFPLTPPYSSLDPEARNFVPASQIELESDTFFGSELALEALQRIESPTTPRIEVSAPVDFPLVTNNHARSMIHKSLPPTRRSSPGGSPGGSPRGRSSSITRERAWSNRKSSPMSKAMATRIMTTLDNMPANRQGPYTPGDRTNALRELHLHASYPPPMPVQFPPYSDTTALAPGSLGQGYRCNHNGCGESARVWDTKSERDHHIRKHVPKDQRAHVCNYCGKTFHFPKDLKRHVSAVHHKKQVICPYCGSGYSRKDNLERHIKSLHKHAQSSRSASQMSGNSPTASTPVSHGRSQIDDTGHTTPLNLSPAAATSNPWLKHHHRHDSVNEPSNAECYSQSESPFFAQPMTKSFSNRL